MGKVHKLMQHPQDFLLTWPIEAEEAGLVLPLSISVSPRVQNGGENPTIKDNVMDHCLSMFGCWPETLVLDLDSLPESIENEDNYIAEGLLPETR